MWVRIPPSPPIALKTHDGATIAVREQAQVGGYLTPALNTSPCVILQR